CCQYGRVRCCPHSLGWGQHLCLALCLPAHPHQNDQDLIVQQSLDLRRRESSLRQRYGQLLHLDRHRFHARRRIGDERPTWIATAHATSLSTQFSRCSRSTATRSSGSAPASTTPQHGVL